jgi:F-type H+-transporting ATPase subunit b
MQQLFEAFGIDGRLILAQAVNFGIVLVALRYFLYTPVMKSLDARRALVAKGVHDAEQATIILTGADVQAKETSLSAEKEAQLVLTHARNEASSEKARILGEAEARAAALSRDAELRAQENAAKMLRESEKEIARISVLAAEKVLKERHA